MPLLSSPLLLRTHALSMVTVAYYLVVSPYRVLTSTPIWLLGESMGVRLASYAPEHAEAAPKKGTSLLGASVPSATASERELFTLVAVILVVYAVMQFLFAGELTLISLSSGGQNGGRSKSSTASAFGEQLHTLVSAQSRWLGLAGVHVLASSALVFWIYTFHSHTSSSAVADATGLVAGLTNRVVFTAALADMLFWGYLWTVLKDEAREVAKMLARRRESEEEEDE